MTSFLNVFYEVQTIRIHATKIVMFYAKKHEFVKDVLGRRHSLLKDSMLEASEQHARNIEQNQLKESFSAACARMKSQEFVARKQQKKFAAEMDKLQHLVIRTQMTFHEIDMLTTLIGLETYYLAIRKQFVEIETLLDQTIGCNVFGQGWEKRFTSIKAHIVKTKKSVNEAQELVKKTESRYNAFSAEVKETEYVCYAIDLNDALADISRIESVCADKFKQIDCVDSLLNSAQEHMSLFLHTKHLFKLCNFFYAKITQAAASFWQSSQMPDAHCSECLLLKDALDFLREMASLIADVKQLNVRARVFKALLDTTQPHSQLQLQRTIFRAANFISAALLDGRRQHLICLLKIFFLQNGVYLAKAFTPASVYFDIMPTAHNADHPLVKAIEAEVFTLNLWFFQSTPASIFASIDAKYACFDADAYFSPHTLKEIFFEIRQNLYTMLYSVHASLGSCCSIANEKQPVDWAAAKHDFRRINKLAALFVADLTFFHNCVTSTRPNAEKLGASDAAIFESILQHLNFVAYVQALAALFEYVAEQNFLQTLKISVEQNKSEAQSPIVRQQIHSRQSIDGSLNEEALHLEALQCAIEALASETAALVEAVIAAKSKITADIHTPTEKQFSARFLSQPLQ